MGYTPRPGIDRRDSVKCAIDQFESTRKNKKKKENNATATSKQRDGAATENRAGVMRLTSQRPKDCLDDSARRETIANEST